MLIRTTSPISMKGGTRIFSPVSVVASFCWLVAVAPLMAGMVSVIFRVHRLGEFVAHHLPVMETRLELRVGFQVADVIAEDFGGNGLLVIGFQIHQDMPGVVGIEILDRTAVEIHHLDIVGSADALIHDRALGHITQLELHLSPQIARGVMVGIRDDKQLTINNHGLAAANFTCSHYLKTSVVGGLAFCKRRAAPFRHRGREFIVVSLPRQTAYRRGRHMKELSLWFSIIGWGATVIFLTIIVVVTSHKGPTGQGRLFAGRGIRWAKKPDIGSTEGRG